MVHSLDILEYERRHVQVQFELPKTLKKYY